MRIYGKWEIPKSPLGCVALSLRETTRAQGTYLTGCFISGIDLRFSLIDQLVIPMVLNVEGMSPLCRASTAADAHHGKPGTTPEPRRPTDLSSRLI